MALTWGDLDKTMQEYVGANKNGLLDSIFAPSPLLASLRSSAPSNPDFQVSNPIGYKVDMNPSGPAGDRDTFQIGVDPGAQNSTNFTWKANGNTYATATKAINAGEVVFYRIKNPIGVEDVQSGGTATIQMTGVTSVPTTDTVTLTDGTGSNSIVELVDQRINNAYKALSDMMIKDMADFYTNPRQMVTVSNGVTLKDFDFENPAEPLAPLEPMEYTRRIELAD